MTDWRAVGQALGKHMEGDKMLAHCHDLANAANATAGAVQWVPYQRAQQRALQAQAATIAQQKAWQAYANAPPATGDRERIAELEAERDHWRAYADKLATANVELGATNDRLTDERDQLQRWREHTASVGFVPADSASSVAELARLRAWLSWMSVSSGDAVLALRGDAAPEMCLGH